MQVSLLTLIRHGPLRVPQERPRVPRFGCQAGRRLATELRKFEEAVPPEAKADLEDLAQYVLRNPFSVEKMTLESPGDIVIYRSRLNAKINRNFEVFSSTDFLAAITQHIHDKGAQMVRYYGWYSPA
jgi:hypothetical protein